MTLEVPAHEEGIGGAIADSVHVDSIQIHPPRRLPPGAAEEIHAVTATNQSREDFPEMKLGTASLRIFVVLPVQYEYSH
jgi:hypothetical protein